VEFADVVRRRRMVRNYDPDRPVPPELLDRLLGYAVHAPSAGFSQGWAFLVLTEPAHRQRFWNVDGTAADPADSWLAGMRHAPVLIIVHANKDTYLDRYAEPDKGWADRDEKRWPVPYWYIDAGFASLLMLLGAVDEGLAACFFGLPAERIAPYRETFGVPESFTPIGVISLGYAAPDRRSPSLKRGRRPVSAVAYRGSWGSAY
jgi:nitroreductase